MPAPQVTSCRLWARTHPPPPAPPSLSLPLATDCGEPAVGSTKHPAGLNSISSYILFIRSAPRGNPRLCSQVGKNSNEITALETHRHPQGAPPLLRETASVTAGNRALGAQHTRALLQGRGGKRAGPPARPRDPRGLLAITAFAGSAPDPRGASWLARRHPRVADGGAAVTQCSPRGPAAALRHRPNRRNAGSPGKTKSQSEEAVGKGQNVKQRRQDAKQNVTKGPE